MYQTLGYVLYSLSGDEIRHSGQDCRCFSEAYSLMRRQILKTQAHKYLTAVVGREGKVWAA